LEIIVVGGGCIGLSLAGELASNHHVQLLEKDRLGRGASWSAAGMIAPVMEAEHGEDELLELSLRSQELYSEFVRQLEDETDRVVDYRTDGTLGLAFDQPQVSELDRRARFLRDRGFEVETLDTEEVRSMEPRISSYVVEGLYVSSERQVDNRKLVEALAERCRVRGVDLHEREPVRSIRYKHDRIETVVTPEKKYQPDFVLLCAGVGFHRIDGLKEPDQMPVRPVKGEALSVRLDEPPEVEYVLRTPDVYCVPKRDGRLVIGGTMREEGFDRRVTAGAVLDLLHEAYEVIPFIYEKELLETWAGLRPASRDSLPILGPSPTTENLAFATGHYRNGILLTPVTVQLLVDWFEDRTVPNLMEPLLPSRFQESYP
jgi:glycine oxidase